MRTTGTLWRQIWTDIRPTTYRCRPSSFLTRAASAFADKVAAIDGARRYTYAQLLDRCVRLASALAQLGVKRLDTVAIIASNIPEMIEAHFSVPMLGAVLNPLNTNRKCRKYRLLPRARGRQGSDR